MSDAGLAYFKDCKSLTHLFLGGTLSDNQAWPAAEPMK